MRRVPVVATITVALAVATMIALGLWQLLIRLPEKEAELALLASNPARPVIAFPTRADDRLLFRRATLDCAAPVTIARAGAGSAGYRLIATCAGGQFVQLGTIRSPTGTTGWPGGSVTGRISHAPDARPLIATLFDHSPKPLLLVADTPAPGLAPNAVPDISSVPNNHLAYAVQWFVFATIALVIYALAMRRRRRG
ncbi:SURF1 family protein [Sphingomonas donggukensis]|uniref:SURF1-like protein n=1 Tax=Sphingomonas donggukensis TaxID=2949093 RepID=A0ABY4TU66_9SPHN|nr:SURF1 family protein [Sphingomonas donggukensis]URW74982.1 SURF1 family protein [Sphingomonas donggukensis]